VHQALHVQVGRVGGGPEMLRPWVRSSLGPLGILDVCIPHRADTDVMCLMSSRAKHWFCLLVPCTRSSPFVDCGCARCQGQDSTLAADQGGKHAWTSTTMLGQASPAAEMAQVHWLHHSQNSRVVPVCLKASSIVPSSSRTITGEVLPLPMQCLFFS